MIDAIKFPDMLSTSGVQTISDKDATYSNLRLMLLSDKGTLFGDPYFGTKLKHTFFSQNGIILKDLVIDEIYTSILEFIPQLTLRREDIIVTQEKTQINAEIRATNVIDHTTNLYQIRLTEE